MAIDPDKLKNKPKINKKAKAKPTKAKKGAKAKASAKPKLAKKKARGGVSAERRSIRMQKLIEQRGEKAARKIAGTKGVSAK